MNSNRLNKNNHALQNLINTTIYDFSDCSICNLCCIDGALYLYESDIKKISKYLKISPKSLVEKYTKYNLKTGEIKIDMPCSFLKNNKCINNGYGLYIKYSNDNDIHKSKSKTAAFKIKLLRRNSPLLR